MRAPCRDADLRTNANGRALVIADDIGVFLAIARSLGRGGVEVDIATSEPDFPGLQSRYIKRVHRVPPYLKETKEWIDAIARLADRHGYNLIVPANDSSLTLLADHADRLGRDRLAIPNHEAIAVFTDKARTKSLAETLGVPVANGIEIEPSTNPAHLEKALGIPLVLKPRSPYETGNAEAKTSARIIRSSDALALSLADFGDRKLLAERFFVGDGVGLSVVAQQGRILLSWQHRRLAAVSDTGRSSLRIGEPVDPALLDCVAKLCDATALTGVAMFEFRHNPANSEFILIEVNPRFWGSLPLALAGGADFPMALWRMTISGDYDDAYPEPVTDVRKGNLPGEYDRLTDLLRSGSIKSRLLAGGSLVKLAAQAVFTPKLFDSWAADDRAPHRAEIHKLAGYLRQAFARRIPGS